MTINGNQLIADEGKALQKGDVIYEVSGEKVDTKAQFRYELYKHQPGDTIEIKYYRGKDKKNTKITLTTSK